MRHTVLAAACCALVSLASCQQSSETEPAATNDPTAMDVILTRTSIRQYTDQPVETEKVETMLRAAMAAPSAVNKQPWRFVVVDDKSVTKAICDSIGGPLGSVERASLCIVVCGDMNAALEGEAHDFWIEDVSAATENLLLAAHAQGLGAVWCGAYPVSERVNALRAVLNIPYDVVPLAIVAIGYPAECPQPKDKWAPEKVRHNVWGEYYFGQPE